MDKALAHLHNIFGAQVAEWHAQYFKRIQAIPNAKSVFDRISSTSDKEQIEDYLAEIRFALIFLGLRFEVTFEPFGKQGPDLQVKRDNHQMIVEVMRFRKVYPGPSALNLEDENLDLPIYGNPPRDVRKSFEKILSKFRQVNGQYSIIAIWNDDEDLEEVEVRTAANEISNDVGNDILSIPHGLLFILYGSKWIGRNKQLHCFPFRILEEPYCKWKTELENQIVSSIIYNAVFSQRSI
jgi:hypothetical protein